MLRLTVCWNVFLLVVLGVRLRLSRACARYRPTAPARAQRARPAERARGTSDGNQANEILQRGGSKRTSC